MWPTKHLSVANLHLDAKNPRIGRETTSRAPREIIQFLFDHDKALEVAQSIATRGFFPNEPLLVIKEEGQFIAVEGNRRLAALKALREPGLLEGRVRRQVERLAQGMKSQDGIAKVPVIIAPNRRATDRQIAGRHIGTPVLAWQAENRASFILDKLEEGYSDDQLRDELNFSLGDIQAARQTRAIADMARSLDLPEEVMAKVNNPRARLFSTLERVIKSPEGQKYLMIEPDPTQGLRGKTTKAQFLKGFGKLVTDVALKNQSSRTLNKGEDIEGYFKSWSPADRPEKKRGSFTPSDIIKGRTKVFPPKEKEKPKKREKKPNDKVIPRSFKVRHGHDRLLEIRQELGKLKRDEFPNAGAVLLRAFFELTVVDYLHRHGQMDAIVARLRKKQGGGKLQFDTPTLRQLVPEIVKIAKDKLKPGEASMVEKAITYNKSAPFTISELHTFVHQLDYPTGTAIKEFWNRTEPLFRLMLESDEEEVTQ